MLMFCLCLGYFNICLTFKFPCVNTLKSPLIFNWVYRVSCVRSLSVVAAVARVLEVHVSLVVVAPYAAVCKAVIVVLNAGSAMQVCTQPQICDERPHWELRPCLTCLPSLTLPPCSLSLSLSISPFSFQRGGLGAATQRKGTPSKVRECVTPRE